MAKYLPLKDTITHFKNDTNLIDLLRFNEMSSNIEYRRTPSFNSSKDENDPILDEDITMFRYYFGTIHNIEPNKSIIGEACFISSLEHRYHPIKSYLNSLEWDGVDRLDGWLVTSSGVEDNIYVRQASSKALIAAVARVFNPGCKFDTMMILEGAQGIGKSTLIEIMAGKWYLDTNFSNKDNDLISSMRGSWLVEIGEMGGLNKRDVTWIRQFLSRKVDCIRLPYDRFPKDLARQSVFIGTMNPSGNNMYLADDTGNRRFWPIECNGAVKFAWLRENRDQIWAEAVVRFKNKEDLYIRDQEAIDIMTDTHKEREVESPLLGILKNWLGVRKYVKMEDIMTGALGLDLRRVNYKEALGNSTMIGINMRKLGWTKGNNEERQMYFHPDYSVYKYREDRDKEKSTEKEGVEWDS
jgi:putative DNA primase/helicase